MERRYSRLGGMVRHNGVDVSGHSSGVDHGKSSNGRGQSKPATWNGEIIGRIDSFSGGLCSNPVRNGGGRNFSCDSDDAEKSNNGRFGEEHF